MWMRNVWHVLLPVVVLFATVFRMRLYLYTKKLSKPGWDETHSD